MGTLTWSYTITGSEGHPSTWLNEYLQQFTGNFSLTVTCTPNATSIYNLSYSFVRSSDSHTCWNQGISFVTGDNTKTNFVTVGSPSFAWSGTDWDRFVFVNTSSSTNPPAGMVFTFTLTGDGIIPSVGVCAYGSEKKEPIGSIISMAPAVAGSFLPVEGIWAIPIILATSAPVIALNVLCANNPPVPQTINEADWTSFTDPLHLPVAYAKIAANFQNTLWSQFCQCQAGPAGSAPPNSPTVVNWNAPTYFITSNITNISNTDIAYTLNQWINSYYAGSIYVNYYNSTVTGDSNTTITNVSEVVADIHTCTCPEYVHGATYTGLTGSGAIDLEQLVGMEVEITSAPGGGIVLPGQPAYRWDMGWMSIVNSNGMLDEKRVTRDHYVWLPGTMRLATSWTYTLREGVELRATKLLAP